MAVLIRPLNAYTPDLAKASFRTNLTSVDMLELCKLLLFNLLIITQQTQDAAGVMLGTQHIHLNTNKRGRLNTEVTKRFYHCYDLW